MTIDLTKPIDVIPELYVCTVSPASGATNPKFRRLNPRKDEAVRHYCSGRYELAHVAMRSSEIGHRCVKSKDLVSEPLESEIQDFVTEAEAYGRLFEAAPRTKLEHGKMLLALKDLIYGGRVVVIGETIGVRGIDRIDEYRALIAEVEQGNS